jgi:hypothetical protein
MGETLILCGNAITGSSGGTKTLRLALTGPNENITLEIDDISRRMLTDVPPGLTDLLEIAAYVYSADQLVKRGGVTMQKLGADWRRNLRFVIPVRELDLWQAPEIKYNLERLLAFMSEDTFCFDFIPSEIPASIDRYFNFSSQADASFPAEKVALFSGGLDSLAGAVETLETEKTRLLLVSHQSSTKIAGHQQHLIRELHSRFPGRLLHVPVRITKKGIPMIEDTQRCRSFLFAAVAMTVSHLSGLKGVRFFENGVVSFNLPIARQVVGARATRSTHPRVMHDLQVFFSALLGKAIRIDNPYIWKTKAEIAAILKTSSHGDLVPFSVSCSHSYGMTRLKTHCGRCSQCLDRRFGTLAAGMADMDPEEMYDTDLLTGARADGMDCTMAESFVRHAQNLTQLSDLGFVGQFGGLVARALPGFPSITPEQVMINSIDLFKRHGGAVVKVLGDGFQQYAKELAEGSLPESCILRLVGNAPTSVFTSPNRGIRESLVPENQKADRRDFRSSSEILLALIPDRKEMLIRGIPIIRGPSSYAFVENLVPTYEEDRVRGLAPEKYRYVRSSQLTKILNITESTLRRRVLRFRTAVAKSFQMKLGLTLAGDAVIQSARWDGYRINPQVHLVTPDQITRPGKGHDSHAKGHDS